MKECADTMLWVPQNQDLRTSDELHFFPQYLISSVGFKIMISFTLWSQKQMRKNYNQLVMKLLLTSIVEALNELDGTFHFTLDLVPANNLETGKPIQISWWIFIWPGVHFVFCLVLCQQRAPPHVDSIEEGHMVGNASPQSKYSFPDETVKGRLLSNAEHLTLGGGLNIEC